MKIKRSVIIKANRIFPPLICGLTPMAVFGGLRLSGAMPVKAQIATFTRYMDLTMVTLLCLTVLGFAYIHLSPQEP